MSSRNNRISKRAASAPKAPSKPPRARRNPAAQGPLSQDRKVNIRVPRDNSMAKVAQQLIDPASIVGVPLPVPTRGGAQIVSRRYRRVIEYTPLGTSFTVIMSPDLEAPGYISGTSAATLPAGAPGYISAKVKTTSSSSARAGLGVGEFDCPLVGFFTSGEKVLAETEAISDGTDTFQGFNLVFSAGSSRSFTLINNSAEAQTLRLYTLDNATGLWAFWVVHSVAAHGTVFQSLSSGVQKDAIAMTCDRSGVQVGLNIAGESAQLTTSSASHFAPAFLEQALELGVSAGRVNSMACKITNVSQHLNKQGMACAGRVPPNFHAFKNISTELSKRPRNRRYHGPAADGIRVGWLPEQVDEWSFDNLDQKIQTYRESQYLIAHFSGLDAASAFICYFDWYVDFTLDSQNFPKITAPPWTDDFEQVVYLLALADAATCNPLSANVFRDLIASAKSYINQGQAHYSRHKDLYDSLLSYSLKALL